MPEAEIQTYKEFENFLKELFSPESLSRFSYVDLHNLDNLLISFQATIRCKKWEKDEDDLDLMRIAFEKSHR